MTDSKLTSIEIGRAALKIAVTGSRSGRFWRGIYSVYCQDC